MRRLEKPKDDPKSVFLTCISAIGDFDLKKRLTACANIVEHEAKEYDTKIKTNQLCTLTKNKSTKANKDSRIIAGQATINEMKDVYTDYFASKDSPGRALYDKLLSIPLNGKCPFCFQRAVSNIDHYLPKAYYPLLAVVPCNLIPSCKDCNTTKLGSLPSNSSQEILHPYYDNVEDDLWLKAEVVQTSPASLNFFVDPPKTWIDILKKRVKYHFDSLELNLLYSAEAATELINIQYQLNELFLSGGSLEVKQHLEEGARSRQMAYTNSWRTAMYTAIAEDDWFCDGGFGF